MQTVSFFSFFFFTVYLKLDVSKSHFCSQFDKAVDFDGR